MRGDGDHGGTPGSREATDPTGAVRVRVDGLGRVEAVIIDQRWRSRINPAELPDSILSTFHSARLGDPEAFDPGLRAGAVRADGGHGTEPLPPLGPGADREARWRRIREMWAVSLADRERRERVVARARQPSEQTGPHGFLTATIHWGGVVALTGEPRQIEYASTDQLRQDALVLLSLANKSLLD